MGCSLNDIEHYQKLEGWRQGIDDLRYVYTLEEIIKREQDYKVKREL